jgi:hypothetical protein
MYLLKFQKYEITSQSSFEFCFLQSLNLQSVHYITDVKGTKINGKCKLNARCTIYLEQVTAVRLLTARVFSRDSPGTVAQWTGKPIRES